MRLFLIGSFVCIRFLAFAQCNVTTTINWVNSTTPACQANNTLQIGGSGVVTFDSPADTYGTEDVSIIYVTGILNLNATGTIRADIVIQNGGRVNINGNVTLLGDVQINGGGTMDISGQLELTASGTCNRNFSIQPGSPSGSLLMNGTASEKLRICGTEVFRGGSSGVCNAFPAGPPPFCAGDSPFSGGSIVPQDGNPLVLVPTGVLPIELLYFTTQLQDESVLIKWATEKEENFDYFELQRAGSDLVFTSIINVPGAGYNTSSLKEYSTTDDAPIIGTGYYRLKAVDIDGSVEYFQVRSVTYNGGKNFYVSPNPTSGSSIKYKINFDPSTSDRVVLIDALGNELATGFVTGSSNDLTPAKTLPPGMYLLRYISEDYQQVVRVFVKE
jgi:hypothetical protein